MTVARLVDRPDLLPDELLYSFLGRLMLLNALPRPQQSLKTLVGGHQPIPGIEFPHGVATLDAALGTASPGADLLLERATLLPYHRAFLPDGRAQLVFERLRYGRTAGLKAAIGLAANRFGAFTELRYCPQCAREDHFLHGVSYWRRSHHLPGVQVCAHHGLSLVHCSTPSRTGSKQALMLPPGDIRLLGQGPPAEASQTRFAQLSTHALHATHTPTSHAHRVAVYQRAAIENGFAGARARIEYRLLADALLVHHQGFAAFEHRDRLLSTTAAPLAWLRPLLARPERAVHPICHLVLIDFLFGSWTAYEDALGSKQAIPVQVLQGTGSEPPPPESRTHSTGPVLDPMLSCRQAAQLARLCVTTVATRRRAAGVPVASRRKMLCGPMMERVRKLVLEGLSPALVAEQTGVSMSTAYRVRREHGQTIEHQRALRQLETQQAHRDAWLELAAQRLTVNAARKHRRACYAWLYRNDREWLAATNAKFSKPLRSTMRIDWAARDRDWSDRVRALACDLHARHPRRRLSPSALLREIGQWTCRANRRKLPMTTAQIQRASQTRAEFQHLRMDEAIDSMLQEGAALQPSRVLKRAGLRRLPRPVHTSFLSTPRLCADDDVNPLPAQPFP